jgi:hypothetical protein
MSRVNSEFNRDLDQRRIVFHHLRIPLVEVMLLDKVAGVVKVRGAYVTRR